MRSDQFSGLVLVALALYVAWAGRAYPMGTIHAPGPGFVPFALAVFLGIIGLAIAAVGARSRRLAEMVWTEAGRALTILAATGVAVYLIRYVGYRLSVMVLMVFLMGIVERKHPITVACLALGFPLLSHYVVADLLLVPLPRSPWGF